MKAISVETRKELAGVAGEIFQCAFEDWREMFGFEAGAQRPLVRVMRSSEEFLGRVIGQNVLVSTRVEGAASGWVMFVFPNGLVGAAIAAAMMLPASDEPSVDATSEEHIEAAQELMNLFCGSATRAIEGTPHRLRISQSVEHLQVVLASATPPAVPAGSPIACISIDVEAGGRSDRAWCLLPESVAEEF